MKTHILLIGVLLLAGCTQKVDVPVAQQTVASSSKSSASSYRTISLFDAQNKEMTVQVEDVRTPEEQQRGLMGRTSLAENHGMLFSFDRPQALGFWMKNTLIPLDIIYFDTAGNFVSAVSMFPCTEDPCMTYPSGGLAQYALEVPLGSIGAWEVGSGWRLQP